MQPTILDFKTIREQRQNQNDKIVFDSIINNNLELFEISINNNKYERLKTILNLSQEEIFLKCRTDDIFCLLFSSSISKTALDKSNDEQLQLKYVIIYPNIGIVENLHNGSKTYIKGDINKK